MPSSEASLIFLLGVSLCLYQILQLVPFLCLNPLPVPLFTPAEEFFVETMIIGGSVEILHYAIIVVGVIGFLDLIFDTKLGA